MTQATLSRKAQVQMGLRAGLAPIVALTLLFGLAGRWNYWQGWVYLGISVVIVALMGTVLTPDRELIEERLNPKQGVKSRDKLYFALSAPMYFIAMALGALDARFGWTRDMSPYVYCGGVLVYVLGSWWACIPQIVPVLLLLWRTPKEDRVLQAELPGYAEYTHETRYRLLPRVW